MCVVKTSICLKAIIPATVPRILARNLHLVKSYDKINLKLNCIKSAGTQPVSMSLFTWSFCFFKLRLGPNIQGTSYYATSKVLT